VIVVPVVGDGLRPEFVQGVVVGCLGDLFQL
jgi:hypothetical protein